MGMCFSRTLVSCVSLGARVFARIGGDCFHSKTNVVEIGRGTFGVVYLDKITLGNRRNIAYKVLRNIPETKVEYDITMKIMNDLRAAKRNAAHHAIKSPHANIIRCYDFKFDSMDNTYTIRMEYLQRSLMEFINANSFASGTAVPLLKKVDIMAGIFNGLIVLHELGYVHNDLKLENIMLDRRLCPKIIDFGFAHECTPPYTTSGRTGIGSMYYMPPEKSRRKANMRLTTNDIYSAGVIMYALLSGSLPWSTLGEYKKYVSVALNESPSSPDTPGQYIRSVELATETEKTLMRWSLQCMHHIAELRPSARCMHEKLLHLKKSMRQ